MEDRLVQLAVIATVAIGAQWLAWRIRLPSILLLLLSGFILGPVLEWIQPDALLGQTLFPFVSLAVAIILFEGGLTLKLSELPATGRVILRLITIGALVTWIVAAVAARFGVGLDWTTAILLGSILIVTGPTVVGPLLRQIRPKGRPGAILKWEGILIDPVGAILAVLVFEAILHGEINNVSTFILTNALKSMVVGSALGLLAAGLLVFLLRRFLIPDHLHNPIALMLVLASFALSDVLSPESGLITVTVMGIALANQRRVPIHHIAEFKENLQVLLVGVLFILLAGRLRLSDLSALGPGAVVLVLALIFVARPLGVLLSTWGAPLTWRERLFIMCMAPRGIVAASVASVFAFELAEVGNEGAAVLAPLTFAVIVGTVVVYGLAAGPIARRLGVAERAPQGVLLVGASPFGQQLAARLGELGVRAVLLDTNESNVSDSKRLGLEAYHQNALAEDVEDELELSGVGRMLSLTRNDEVNSLAALHYAERFGRAEVYQLPLRHNDEHGGKAIAAGMLGRRLFAPGMTYDYLERALADGGAITATPLTDELPFDSYLQQHAGGQTTPLLAVSEQGVVSIYTAEARPSAKPGQTMISLMAPTANDGQR